MSNNPVRWPLDLYVGECDDQQATIYARVPERVDGEIRQIVGRVRGPFSRRASTLPANYPLMHITGASIANATIVDPCPWSPEHPLLYQVDATVHFSKGYVLEYGGKLAIRRFGSHGQSLFLNARRYVLRGIYDYGPTEDVVTWREHAEVRVVRREQGSMLEEAAENGLLIIAKDRSQPKTHEGLTIEYPNYYENLARYPAVCMVVVPSEMNPPDDLRTRTHNFLLAQQVSCVGDLYPWAQIAWIDATDFQFFRALASRITLPIIAERRYRGSSLSEARAAIDALQADLAPIGQFAGYVV